MYRKLLHATVVGTVTLGTLASFRANECDIGAIGIVRLSRAVVTVFQIGHCYKKQLYDSKLDASSTEYLRLRSKVHEYGAQKLLQLCCANKGVYIKVGQHIGALDYLMPHEYVCTMRVLHDSAPRSTFDDVLAVIREDLKRDPYEIFRSIDPEPLGTASLAQVHKAVLSNGQVVAVKVQHRAVKNNSYVDIKTMSTLVAITSLVFPDFKFDWLVAETRRNIPRELDFVCEGKNAERVSRLFADYRWLRVPRVHWDVTTSRVLTMEFLEGGRVNDLEYMRAHRLNPYEVSSKLGRLYSRMIFIDGFVHSDPHPGNILVRNRDSHVEIALLDHGLYADLTDQFRWDYSKLWLAILDGDRTAMRKYCARLGVDDHYGLLACMVAGKTWNTITSGVRWTKHDPKIEKQQFQREIPNLLPQISTVLDRVDRQLLLILKTNDLMRGIEYSLRTRARMSATMVMSRCCVRSVYGEKFRRCTNAWDRCRVSLSERWTLFKLSLYYMYLGFLNFDLNKSVESLWIKDFYPF